MDSNTFMGLFIGALVVIVGLAVALTTLVVRPILNLNKTITEINVTIKNVNDDYKNLQERVTAHGKTLDQHSLQILSNTKDIEQLKGGR